MLTTPRHRTRSVFPLLAALLLATGLLRAEKILIITDIHLDPFAQMEQGAPASQLDRIVGQRDVRKWKFAPIAPNSYGEDTNSALLDLGLAEIERVAVANSVRHIFLCGDMLSHNFEANYAQYVNEPTHLADFASDIILYLHHRLKTATHGAEMYYVLGNNDSDIGDYEDPSSKFMANLATGLFGLLPGPNKSTFRALGYTNRALNRSVRIIGLNGNLLSQFNNAPALAAQQLALLRRDLAACRSQGQRAIMLMHEPFGMDPYSSFKKRQAVTFLHPVLQRDYLYVIEEYAPSIAAIFAGHVHMEYMRTVGVTVPLFGTIALNSLFGNNPGFKLLTLDDRTGDLLDYTTYVQDFTRPKLPWRELYRFSTAYDQRGRRAAEVINAFPDAPSDARVQRYRRYFTGESLHRGAIMKPDPWPYYFAALTKDYPESFTRAVNAREPASLRLSADPGTPLPAGNNPR